MNTNKIEKFYNNITKFPNHRYRSWEHCHNYFFKIKNKKLSKEEKDLAQLHLAFYLASWGMYRGSSFLLQKDYTVFDKIVDIMLDDKYSILWDIKKNYENDNLINLFVELYSEIEKELLHIKESVQKHEELKGKRYLISDRISETLVTKIILGTIGCIPAYDRYFMKGLYVENVQNNFNSKKSFKQMIMIYTKNRTNIDKLTKKFNGYTPMKIIDMYFWQEGYDKERGSKI